MKRSQLALVFGAGGLFGFGLALSGMTDPARVRGFLDVTGAWDPMLVFVMIGALTTYGVGMLLLRRMRNGEGWFGTQLPQIEDEPIRARLIIGSAVFGIGWALGGFCPGPALANLGALRPEALIFVPAMAVGMAIARYAFGADRS